MEAATQDKASSQGKGKFYAFTVDGKEFHTEKEQLTGGEIMDIAGIPRSDGLVQILDDGTQVQVGENEVIVFEGPGRRFKKQPRFQRG